GRGPRGVLATPPDAIGAAPCPPPDEEVLIPLSHSLPCHRLRLQLINEVLLAEGACLDAKRVPRAAVDRIGHEVAKDCDHPVTVGQPIGVGLVEVLDIALSRIRLAEVN